MPDAHRAEIAKLETLFAENPEGRVFTHLAEAYRKAGQLDRARDILEEGLARHPDYSSAHVVLGRVLMDGGEADAAEAEFRRVLELDAHNMVALRSLGDMARQQGRTEDALGYYERLLDVEPADQDVLELVEEMGGGLAAPAARDAGDHTPPHGDPNAPLIPGQPEGSAVGGVPTGEPGVTTETIAQVYARQGLYDRAAEVYRQLVRNRPADPGLRARLEEMEALARGVPERSQDEDVALWDEPQEPEEVSPEIVAGPEQSGLSDLEIERPEPSPSDAETYDLEEPGLEGFQGSELDLDSLDVEPLSGLESDELDPETGLSVEATPEAAEDTEPLPEIESTDVPLPPEEEPWGAPVESPAAPEEEPWLAPPASAGEEEDAADLPTLGTPEDLEPERAEPRIEPSEPEPDEEPWLATPAYGRDAEEPQTGLREERPEEPGPEEPRPEERREPEPEPEAEAVEAVWTGAAGSSSPEHTPYAWDEAEEPEPADEGPPIRDYIRGVLGWSPGAAYEAGDGSQQEPAPPAGESGAAPAEAPSAEPGEDEDLDTFRSWLESLKE